MRIPTWRLALTGGAIVVLLVVGVGMVLGVSSPAASPGGISAAAPAASPGTGATRDRPGLRRLLNRVGPAARRFVDGMLNFTDKDGNLITIQLDHGTIASIGDGTLTISEAGGAQVSLSTDGQTVVRLGGGAGLGKLSDLKIGDEVFVQSRVDAGTTLAKHVLRVPAAAPGATGSATGD
jgi:hypothetical protein